MASVSIMDMFYKSSLEYFMEHIGNNDNYLDDEMMYAAVLALKKRLPKPAVDRHTDTVCPACHESLYLEDLGVVEKSRYCSYCGQKLKWQKI